jgi:ubiquinone biosynthesis protein
VLRALARFAERTGKAASASSPMEVVREYEKDHPRRARPDARGRQCLAVAPKLRELASSLCACRALGFLPAGVMVMERIRGVQISNMAKLREAGHRHPQAGGERRRIFFTQVFRHNFFHADMHPGNIFVLIDNPAQPKYAAVDFGIVGTLDPRDQYYLAENFLAVFRSRLSKSRHAAPGIRLGAGRLARRRDGIRHPHGLRTHLQQAAEGDFLRHGAAAAVRDLAPLQCSIQPQLILLQKTLLNIEGLGATSIPTSTSSRPQARSCASGCAKR